MKLFKENLLNYEKNMGLSSADVAELSELDPNVISMMERGNANMADVMQLCTKMEIAYSSIFDDKGFQKIPILDQYNKYPSDLARMITRAFFRNISSYVKKKGGSIDTVFHRTLAGRLKTGSAAFTVENIHNLEKGVTEFINKEDFYSMLAECMYSKIPNYNYVVARRVFNLSYNTISKALGVSPAAASQWGGKFATRIPDNRLDQLLECFPGLSKSKFETRPMTDKEMGKYECKIVPEETVKSIKKVDFPDPPAAEVKEVVESEGASQVTRITKMNLTNEQAMKLYSVLDPIQQQKVNNFISRLFFS